MINMVQLDIKETEKILRGEWVIFRSVNYCKDGNVFITSQANNSGFSKRDIKKISDIFEVILNCYSLIVIKGIKEVKS